ncbi:MAG: NHLP bacteriocin export ABC transporter permease/ATPase subunit, partial [Alphaproteobacteria bacterium]|nr:NHLP bacteriocin export ABC transporter permease/ATPase subunit [Alphaproteobacteria bacterium]
DAEGCETVVRDARGAAAIAPLAHAIHIPLPDQPLGLMDLLTFGLGRCRGDLAVVLLMGALGGLLGLAVPFATAMVFDVVVPGHERGRLVQIGMALCVAALSIFVFRVVGDVALLRVEGRLAGGAQAAIVDRMLRLPLPFFSGYSSGDLAARALAVESIRRALTGVAVSSLVAGAFSVFNFGLLFYYEWRAALIGAGLLALLAGVTVWAGMAQLRAIFEGEALTGNIYGVVQQLIAGIPKLRLAGAEERAFVQWGRIFAELRARVMRMNRINVHLEVFRSMFDVLVLAAVFAVTALSRDEDMATGAFLAFVAAFSSLLAAARQVSGAVVAVFRTVPLAQRVRPLLEAVPETDARKADPGRLTGAIELTGVVFRYQPGMPRVLNGLTVSIKAGEQVAVVGRSGCGKSTLVRLLLGFEKPEAGGVFYDGRDLRGLDLLEVRRQVGVVLQSSRLMPGSIFENVRGATDAEEEQVREAIRMAGMDEDVRAMPMGLHTVLTEGASTLSGGQAQRLLIARALIMRPRVLILDEATSALDNRTQAVVTESVAGLPMTRIVIAHRLSTLVHADRVCVLDGGRVVEQGGWRELMSANGLFAHLARRQMD